jgi:hypothetical protein
MWSAEVSLVARLRLGWRYASLRLRYLPAMSCEGVEDFLTEFANLHCAVEAEHFLPNPRPGRRANAKLAAAQRSNKQQTNNKHSCARLFELMWVAARDLINKAASRGVAPGLKAGLTTTTQEQSLWLREVYHQNKS